MWRMLEENRMKVKNISGRIICVDNIEMKKDEERELSNLFIKSNECKNLVKHKYIKLIKWKNFLEENWNWMI